jgi:hypothetical protein
MSTSLGKCRSSAYSEELTPTMIWQREAVGYMCTWTEIAENLTVDKSNRIKSNFLHNSGFTCHMLKVIALQHDCVFVTVVLVHI